MALKFLRGAEWIRRLTGAAMAHYFSLVWNTSKFTFEPADLYERLGPEMPAIVTTWHGHHFLAPFLRLPHHRVKALISLHHDADINAIAVERLGMQVIRGSGDHEGRFDRKGGVRAFIAMRHALEHGWTMAVTADVPKVAKVVGRGLVMLARNSGRPIYPIGVATSGRITLKNWDGSAINLPFSRGAMVLGEPVRVPATADDAMLEICRRQVEESLNAATARAYSIVDAVEEKDSRA
jgi:lysophospholipid acyltransferase (LPLAT)-like uncharacterized protein